MEIPKMRWHIHQDNANASCRIGEREERLMFRNAGEARQWLDHGLYNLACLFTPHMQDRSLDRSMVWTMSRTGEVRLDVGGPRSYQVNFDTASQAVIWLGEGLSDLGRACAHRDASP